MTDRDKDIERLIVRWLDQELSEEEKLQLDRELIRNPEAHRLMEEYQRIDELAATAIGHALGKDRMPLDLDTLPARANPTPLRGRHRGWWLIPGAIAAALLAIVTARFPATPPSQPQVAEITRTTPTNVAPALPYAPRSAGLMRTIGTNPGENRIRRVTGREVLGVVGEDGNIYWIEVDRIRTITRPSAGSAAEEL